jgi:ABC-2 family transporter protein
MSWLTEALGGPVLAWEVKRATRGNVSRCLLIGYCAWLVIQAVAMFGAFGMAPAGSDDRWDLSKRLELYREMYAQQIEFFDHYLVILLQFQLVLIIAIVPAITASSLGQEKERGTLFALFGTQLTSWQILLGKLLGRLILIVPLLLGTLPILVFIATWTGQGLTPIFLALAQEATIAFALGAACLLFAIWIRRTADAVIASYLFLGMAYVFIQGFTASLPEAFWFDPVENLQKLLGEKSRLAFAVHLAVWVLLSAICLRLGWGRLRKACVEQRDRRPPRRLWAFRPPVGDDPIRWRECYVIGLAPLPVLRLVPRWLALLAVFTFSAALAGIIANDFAPGFMAAILRIDLVEALEKLLANKDRIADGTPLMGLVFILLACLLIGVRCGTSVAEEKRRNTWDDLLLTAQSFREITTSKMWGILQATVPYIIAYALPVFFLAALGGTGPLVAAGTFIVLPCAIVFVAALSGIDMVKVPPDMDETQPGGAFWFENNRPKRRR